MWVSVGFLLCSELPSSKFSNYGERSEARENARIEAEEKESSPSLSSPLALSSPFACCSRGLLATPPNVEFALRLCSERFSPPTQGFPLSSKTKLPNSNSTRNNNCGCTASKPLFLFFNFLFIVLLHATQLKSFFFPFISTYHRYKTIMNKTLNMINLLKWHGMDFFLFQSVHHVGLPSLLFRKSVL